MTRRTVIWVPEAEHELGEIWLAAADRDAVASAADTIDALLKTNAEILGSELAEGLKGFDCEPLRVLFEIIEEDALVRVLTIKRVD
jgi:plasmid stabilization system protein ParE